MPYFTITKIRDKHYIYGSVSTRHKGGEYPSRTSKCLGSIDPISNSPIFNASYIPWLIENNLSVETSFKDFLNNNQKYSFIDSSNFKIQNSSLNSSVSSSVDADNRFNKSQREYDNSKLRFIKILIEDLKAFDIKLVGASYLLKHISDNVGLTDILRKIFPDNWQTLLSLTFFYTIEQDPLMYCTFFIDSFDELSRPEDLTSQNISALMSAITDEMIVKFFQKWSMLVKELDYIALDTTSISTYSKLNEDAAFGHPKQRTNNKMKQLNVCLLFGEKTGLPLYSCTYNGSINDVTAFIHAVKQYDLITKNRVKYVLDCGMFSKKNINYMIDINTEFIIGLPATTKLNGQLIDDFQYIFENPTYTVSSQKNNIYGITKRIIWDKSQRLWAHVFIDQNKRLEIHNNLQNKIFDLYNQAKEDPEDSYKNIDCFPYIDISKTKTNNYLVKINCEAFTQTLSKAGWFVFLSNGIKDTTDALSIYRHRDVVEMAFDILKKRTQEQNIAVHSNHNASTKLFIGFLSLILTSQVHKTMSQENLYKHFTIKELFSILNSIKKLTIDGKTVYSPLTAKHELIFDKFKCPPPTDSI
jgi:transposase